MSDAPPTALPAWQALESHAVTLRDVHMRELFAADPDRFTRLSFSLGSILVDYSKNRVTQETLGLLMALARARQVEAGRAAMFAGALLNATENRAAFHAALRNRADRPMKTAGLDVMPEVRAARDRLKAFSEKLRSGGWTGATGKAIRHVVNIGIGGSHLGPMMTAAALKDFQRGGPSLAFVSNPDRAQLDEVLNGCDPAETLFIIASKTFTTAETAANANAARRWLTDKLGEGAVSKHFAAVSTNLSATAKFGISPDAVFPMWDWVGGRYSVWSAIGLPVMLACGFDCFDQFLAGGEAMDRHFETASLEQNLPVILALLGVWYVNFLGANAHAVLPYDHALRLLPAHLQQLDMESNGKSIGKDGSAVSAPTGPIVFGGGGSDSQHSFFQSLHQGTQTIPCDFIAAAKGRDAASHDVLLANAFAQAEALMLGRDGSDLPPHRRFSGNRPSNFLLLDEITPYTLGMVIALYEHKVFVQGLIWGVNSFDQWGVELGKDLAKSLEPLLRGNADLAGRDCSTAGLAAAYRKAKTGRS